MSEIYLFLDSNIYLNFYHYSKDDIKTLDGLYSIVRESEKIHLLINDQVISEVERNRESKIKDAIDKFKKSEYDDQIPKLFSGFTDVESIKKLSKSIQQLRKNILDDVSLKIQEKKLEADILIELLFKNKDTIDQDIITKAEKRFRRGLPPGKDPKTIGDQINWEYLLQKVPQGKSLHLVSEDKDYCSMLDESQISPVLAREWINQKKGAIYLYKSLTSFFNENFPDTRLKGEYYTYYLIDALENSISFDTSRSVLENLSHIQDFSNDQINKIIKISLENNQVYNAHKYSPTTVGQVLEKIIKDRHADIDYDLYAKFCDTFDIEPELRWEDIPF